MNSNDAADLTGRVARALEPALAPGAHFLLGLSGGLDSIALLAILAELAPTLRFSFRALHVNHGISPNAAEWARFCSGACARLHVPLCVEEIDVAPFRHLGREGAARAARYEAFERHAADCLVLAHHRDDQAETLLLQLLRGAGLAGLSGMGAWQAGGRTRRQAILRPLLGAPRTQIEAFARARGLDWIDDESNADTALKRNYLRHRLLPDMEVHFPGARECIARSAGHIAEAAELLDRLGRIDLDHINTGDGVEVAGLRELGAARGRNALRTLCRTAGAPVPSTARLEELWRQLVTARGDAQPRVRFGDWVFLRYRTRLYLERRAMLPDCAEFCVSWCGQSSLPLLELGGILRFKPEEGRGLSVEKLRAAPVTVRLRRGGEHLRADARRPRRTLKNLLQENAVPPWRRNRLPLLYCGDTLVSVPGIGDESEWQAGAGQRGLIVSWEVSARPRPNPLALVPGIR